MKVAGEFELKDFMNFKVTKSVLKISYILVEHRNPASFLLFLAFRNLNPNIMPIISFCFPQ